MPALPRGSGSTAGGESQGGEESAAVRATHLAEFLRRGLVAPRPGQNESDATKRGQQVFMSEQTQCAKCHVPDTEYSDRASVALRDVPPIAGHADERSREFKTPSLRFVGQTPPYFHDGRYLTLEDLVEKNADGMGKTSHLSPEQKSDLVAFLRSL